MASPSAATWMASPLLPPSVPLPADTLPIITITLWGGMSGLLSLWPDIDEPNSKASRTATMLLTAAAAWGCAAVVLRMADQLHRLLGSWVAVGAGGILLTILVSMSVALLVRPVMRLLTGGHRRWTHSVLLTVILIGMGMGAAVGVVPWLDPRWPWWLAWGQLWHVLPDLTTPDGVPLAYPIRSTAVRFGPWPEWLVDIIGAIVSALSWGIVIRTIIG